MSTPQPAAAPASLSVLHFECAGQHYAIELALVERVLPLAAMEPLPGAPAHLAGLLNYHGNNLCGIDLALWLGLETITPYHIDTPVIVCVPELFCAHPLALIVDEVLGVECVEQARLQLGPELSRSQLPIAASLNIAACTALLLDMHQLFSRDFLQPSPYATTSTVAHSEPLP